MNGHPQSSAPSGPKSFKNGGTRSQYNGNQYNGNRSRNNQNHYNNHNNQYSNNHHNQNYNYNHGNGNGNVNRNVNPNPNYKGKNFNPNYKGKNFNPNYQRPRGGSVADARGSPESQLNGQGPFTGVRNNHRNRNRKQNNKSLPQKFKNIYRDLDIIMIDAPSDEPNDIEMPDAPPLPVDPVSEFDQSSILLQAMLSILQRIEAFTTSAQAVQQIVSFFMSPSPVWVVEKGHKFTF